MTTATPITVAYGDGIGPEIMEAVLTILREAGAELNIETIQVGEQVYKQGNTTGIPASAWESLRRTQVLLKAPITTPQGGGYKSLNVTMRKTLGLYSNVRPTVAYHPFVNTSHPDMNLVIVRENEEDLYAGIEYQSSHDAVHAIKLITRSGCERIVRYAFEYAVKNGRKKVTCMSKDNIMKQVDGLFHQCFDAIGKEYPQIEQEHYIIDIGSARIASKPGIFDVIVTENLYGDIISDIAAEVSGSVGLAGSANIGTNCAMFEAIHGSAPDIAGKNIANPSGLLHGAIMMLVHIGQPKVASRVHNAWLCTLEDGIHTGDVYQEGISRERVGTKEFAAAVVERMHQLPKTLKPVTYSETPPQVSTATVASALPVAVKQLVGVDVFLAWDKDVEALGERISKIDQMLKLQMIDNKGLKIWPEYTPGMNLTDQFRARFLAQDPASLRHRHILHLLQEITDAGIEFVKTEHLYTFDGKAGYSLGQGQ